MARILGLNTPTDNDEAANKFYVDGAVSGGSISSLNGLTASIQTFATGTAGSDFAIVSSVSTHTFNLPDASVSDRGVVTIGTQTFAGLKTFATTVTLQADLQFSAALATAHHAGDSNEIHYCGGSSPSPSNGAYISMYGATHGSFPGLLNLVAGTGSNGQVRISTISASDVQIYTTSLLRWSIVASGDIVPNGDNSFDIGTSSFRVKRGYFLNLDHAGSGLAIQTSSATQWIFDASGNLNEDATNGGDIAFSNTTKGVKNTVNNAVAAAGTTQGTATAINTVVSIVTSSTIASAEGVQLPSAATHIGKEFIIRNEDGVDTVQVYPASGEQINSLGANNSFALITGTVLRVIATSSTQWYQTQ